VSSAGAGTLVGAGLVGTSANTLTNFTTASAGKTAIAGSGASTTVAFVGPGAGQVVISAIGVSTVTQVGSGIGNIPARGTGTSQVSAFAGSGSGQLAVYGLGSSTTTQTSSGTGTNIMPDLTTFILVDVSIPDSDTKVSASMIDTGETLTAAITSDTEDSVRIEGVRYTY
jgi:hypothetical protein